MGSPPEAKEAARAANRWGKGHISMAQFQVHDIKQRLRRLGAFSVIFGAEDFQFGTMHFTEANTGEIMMPYYSFSSEADTFIQTCYDDGWVLGDFDWSTWGSTPEAIKLADNRDAMTDASPDQVAKLLTFLIRQERFCAGTLAGALESGLLEAILHRAMALAHDE
jgi:hypothetical protein